MKITYDFDQFSKLKCQHNDSVGYRYLPFKFNYWMFRQLCDLERDLTLSEMFDKVILLRELWSKMCSQVLEEYMQKEAYYGRREEEISCY